MNITQYCDALLNLGVSRFSCFKGGPIDEFKAALETEFVRRGYDVKWFSDNSELTWVRPEGYVSRRDCFNEVFLAKQAFEFLAQNPDRDIYIDAMPAQLLKAAAYLGEQLKEIEHLPDGNYQVRRKAIGNSCEAILTQI